MATQNNIIEQLTLSGLEIAPSQMWGGVRLVPLLRRKSKGDLRLARRDYNEPFAGVSLNDRTGYFSYIPHGLVLSWSDDGSPVGAFGGQFTSQNGVKRLDGQRTVCATHSYRWLHRMAKREIGSNRLRFLPLHLAMEGFLALHFGGPDIAWTEYSRQAIRDGLSPRWETVLGGRAVAGLDEALRIFERHETQVGMLVFVAEGLASAFVTPSPDDYRLLHDTLLEDFYPEILYYYGLLYPESTHVKATFREEAVSSLGDLRKELVRARSDWAEYQTLMAGDLLGRSVTSERVYQAGPFTLQRFVTDLDQTQENHIGEAIVRTSGDIEYLKTFRLSGQQTRRAYLLKMLAAHQWDITATAESLKTTYLALIRRIEDAGFGYLINREMLEIARREQREGTQY